MARTATSSAARASKETKGERETRATSRRTARPSVMSPSSLSSVRGTNCQCLPSQSTAPHERSLNVRLAGPQTEIRFRRCQRSCEPVYVGLAVSLDSFMFQLYPLVVYKDIVGIYPQGVTRIERNY